MAREKPTNPAAGKLPVDPERARYLSRREGDAFCRIHKVSLDETGYCLVAKAWWYPRFACPQCHGWLWDNGYCPSCTPKTSMFPGDYFEQRWDEDAGREYGHFVRVSTGPSPAPTALEVQGYVAEMRAHAARIGEVDAVPF